MKKLFVLGLVVFGLAACCCNDRDYYYEQPTRRTVEYRASCDCNYAPVRSAQRCGC